MNTHWGSGRLSRTVLLLGLMSTLASAAEERPPAIETLLVSIQRLYGAYEYEQAFLHIQRARKLSRGVEDEVRLFLYEGLVLAEMGNFNPAESAFRSALLLQPDRDLPVQSAPKIEALFEEQRRLVRQKRAVVVPTRVVQPLAPVPQAVQPALVTSPPDTTAQRVLGQKTVAPPTPSEKPAPMAKADLAAQAPRTLRDKAPVTIALGVVTAAAGGTLWRLSSPSHSTSPDRGMHLAGISLVGLGSLAVLSGVGMYVWGGPESSTALTLGTTGTSAFVQGRWP